MTASGSHSASLAWRTCSWGQVNHSVAAGVAPSSVPPRGWPSSRVMATVPGRYRRRRHRSLPYPLASDSSSSSSSSFSFSSDVGILDGTLLDDGAEDGSWDDCVGEADVVGDEEGMFRCVGGGETDGGADPVKLGGDDGVIVGKLEG